MSKDSTTTNTKKDLTTFDGIIDMVLQHEGGYVNDPADPGGETKYGISKRAYPNVNIKNLTKNDAKEIYKEDYWGVGKCDKIPPHLRHIYFDMCVNFGIGKAVGVLQRAANSKSGNRLDIDGKLGPLTLGSIKNLEVDRVRSFRVLRFAEITINNPNLSKFWVGWYRRATEV